MFSDNLSTSVLQLCDTYDLSYEAASERCNLSPRYFGSVARGQTAASIITLEKLCIGFDQTPNDLLRIYPRHPELVFRTPMPVIAVKCMMLSGKLSGFPICPQCGSTLDREYQEYQNFCGRCGQKLDWKNYHKAAIILPDK